MIASLPMYARPEAAGALDRLWTQFGKAWSGDAPNRLTQGGDPWDHWQSPDLFLSQTCGMPYRTRLHGKVALVGSPSHGLPDLEPGYYRSVFVVREEMKSAALADLAHARFAYNAPDSQSGWAAASAHMTSMGLKPFRTCLRTGSHAASARAVAENRADIASLDIISWAMIERWDAWARALVPLDYTEPSPALPFITADCRHADRLREALSAAIGSLSVEDRRTLLLKGVTFLPAGTYLAVPNPPPPN